MVINSVPKEKRVACLQDYEIGKMLPIEKALGVTWFIEVDELGFRISVQDSPLTRRNILATISSIYDPLGLIAPFLLIGRKILQAIAVDKYSWDHELHEDHRVAWTRWRQELEQLNNSQSRDAISLKVSISLRVFLFITSAMLVLLVMV